MLHKNDEMPEGISEKEKGSSAMSEATSTPEKPAAPEAAQAAAPEAPEVKPFNPDVLISCTARFTRKSWDLFLKYRKENLELMRTVPLRTRLTARTPQGAQEIQQILMKENGVTEIKATGKVVDAIATFEALQSVIKHPQSHMCEVTPAQK